jgi:hypothetical protein
MAKVAINEQENFRLFLSKHIWLRLCCARQSVVSKKVKKRTFHKQQETCFPICNNLVVLPWPTVYEMLRTRFVKNQAALQQFEKFLKAPNIIYLDDTKYRRDAFDLSLKSSLRRRRPLSMVDCLLRLVIDDPNVKIDYLLTFNPGDFADACHRNRVEIL